MNKYKELVKNIGLLTISSFGSKILTFLLIPLYTSILTTEEYGQYDIVSTTITLLLPILTVNISDAVLRFLLDKNSNKKTICKIGLKINLASIFIVIVFLLLNSIFNLFDVIRNFSIEFLLFYISLSFLQLFQNIVRGIEKIQVLSISGIISTISTLLLNIVFLVTFNFGLRGYFYANIIANTITCFYLLFNIRLKKQSPTNEQNTKKTMIKYSRPLILNSIGWWINNVSDRYVVMYFCGMAANGIYSIAYKIPSIIAVIQTVINQAWSISSVKEFDKKDSDNFFKNTYDTYNIILTIICSLLICFSKLLASYLYKNDFYEAWSIMPWLMLSMVFGALSGILGGIFSAVKDTKTLGLTTFIGATTNIVLNIILVIFIGPIGAAIATLISSIAIWLIRIIVAKKYITLRIDLLTDIIAYMVLLLQIITLTFISEIILYWIELLFTCIILFLYRKKISTLLKKVWSKK